MPNHVPDRVPDSSAGLLVHDAAILSDIDRLEVSLGTQHVNGMLSPLRTLDKGRPTQTRRKHNDYI
jgi:hypothetical protein